jgi:DNA-binding CsgD family transcriptional regulator
MLLGASKRVLAGLHHEGRAIAETAFEQLDAEFGLRIVPLTGELTDFFAVFIEPIGGRNLLATARKRYALTKRELQVVGQIVKGYPTSRIAPNLFISEGTVGDHIKSIYRKTGTSSRAELLARLFEGGV